MLQPRKAHKLPSPRRPFRSCRLRNPFNPHRSRHRRQLSRRITAVSLVPPQGSPQPSSRVCNSRRYLPIRNNFKPVFEPGSVFERVSRGDFDKQEQMVQVGGYTSQQAKTTSDYTVQFQIARHAQLLPFLAMNPSLYDDLYTWLAAQGNADVDAALSRNQGYQEYRKAVGK